MVSAAESPPQRGDSRHNGVDPLTGAWQTGWLGEVPANHSGAKLAQCCIVGLRPYQALHLVAVFAQHTDHPATQLACPTDDEDHPRPSHSKRL
jgi:hypothetical protein